MRRIVLAIVLVLAACGEKPDPAPAAEATYAPAANAPPPAEEPAREPMRDYVEGVVRFADAVAAVRDETSAQAAAGELAKINAELAPLAREIAAMSDRERKEAALAHNSQLVTAQKKIVVSAANLSMAHPELMTIISSEVDKLPEID